MFTLLVPLLIAAISGLAYLAVKHPAVYEKLFGRVYFISGIVFGALLIWSGSISWAHTTLLQFIEPEKHASAKASIEAITIPVPRMNWGQTRIKRTRMRKSLCPPYEYTCC